MTSLWRVKFLWSAGMSRFFGCMFVTHTQAAGMLNRRNYDSFVNLSTIFEIWDLHSGDAEIVKASEMWRCGCGRVVSDVSKYRTAFIFIVELSSMIACSWRRRQWLVCLRVLHLLCIVLVLTKIQLNTLIAICLIFDTTIPSTFWAHSVNHYENTA